MTNSARLARGAALCAALIGVAACASGPNPADDARQCARNFREMPGVSNYQTTVSMDGVTRAQATERLDRELSRMGFRINESNPDRGRVGGTFDAGTSVVQVSAFIDSRQGGADAELNIAGTGAGIGSVMTPAGAYRNDLCRFERAMRGET